MECASDTANADKFLILPISEGSRTVTEVLSKEGSFRILELLSEGPLSVREVSQRTGLSFVEVEDKLKALMESDLVEIKSMSSGKDGDGYIYGPAKKVVAFSSEDKNMVV
ncbi:MAG: ArsR family transcriptional regulator [Halobacteriota archaeon]